MRQASPAGPAGTCSPTSLFDRSGRLRPNDTGRLFRDYVERSLGGLEAVRRAVAKATCEGVRTVRLASETLLTLTGPLAIDKRAHPSVEVELRWSAAEDMARRLRAQEVDLCVTLPADPPRRPGAGTAARRGGEWPTSLGHPLADRASVSIEELADQPVITARQGALATPTPRSAPRRQRPDTEDRPRERRAQRHRRPDQCGRHRRPDQCETRHRSRPAIARRATTRAPLAWIAVDSPDCRRALTLFWGADSHLSTAARLMRTAITSWNWSTGEPPQSLG